MFRTRDYALMLATMVFLLVGIATTVALQGGLPGVGGMAASVFESTPEPTVYEVSVPEKAEPGREARIADLRKKIAALGIADEPEPTPVDSAETSPLPEAEEVASEDKGERRCPNYTAAAVAWNPSGLIIEEAEGARLVYRKIVGAPLGSSTVPTITKDVVLQLPVRSVPLSSESCVTSDVIGIATDGSLIRNNEVGAYGVFGAGTLVGYALDGFPIYGTSDQKTDICGGAMVGGQYRYLISGGRETIINCFAGSPVAL
jgi:hypothetical protein